MLRSYRGWFLLVVLISLSVLLLMSPVHAQVEPALRITKIDVQNFPDVKVYLRGEKLAANLSELPVTLSENGQEIAMADLSSEMEEVGTQSALLLDASGSVLEPGLTGVPRHLEVGNVTNRLVELGVLSEADWLAAYASDSTGKITDIQDWTRDHQAAANELYTYQPPNNIDLETPLYDLIFFALDRFEREDVPDNTAKRMVLFSDGITGSSDLKLDDAVDRARAEKVPIDTVLLGPETEESMRNMNRIAKLTGGEAYQLTSLDVLDDLWKALAEGGEQRVLSYRSQREQPREVLASVTLPDGASVEANKAFPIVELQPVQINIIPPTNDWTISKEAPEHNTPLEELEPKTLTIQAEFSWSDGYPRNLMRVEYVIGNNTQVQSEEPFNQMTFPIDSLDKGNYTIRVMAIDELGVKGESLPIPFRVDVMRPDAPIPTLVSESGPEQLALIIVSVIAVTLGVLAVIIALRKPTVRERVTQVVSDTLPAVTEPFKFKGQASRDVKARLSVVNKGRALSLPATIDIYGGIRIGRSSEAADLVINDQRVSRIHCRIKEDADKLRLYDEGAASGTYVNYQPVDINGHVLQSNDLIHVGPVQFRFHYQNDYISDKTMRLNPDSDSDSDPNKTEPSQPIAPQAPKN